MLGSVCLCVCVSEFMWGVVKWCGEPVRGGGGWCLWPPTPLSPPRLFFFFFLRCRSFGALVELFYQNSWDSNKISSPSPSGWASVRQKTLSQLEGGTQVSATLFYTFRPFVTPLHTSSPTTNPSPLLDMHAQTQDHHLSPHSSSALLESDIIR